MQCRPELLQAMLPPRAFYSFPVPQAHPARIPSKDKTNDCTLFTPRVTVALDGTASQSSAPPSTNVGLRPTR